MALGAAVDARTVAGEVAPLSGDLGVSLFNTRYRVLAETLGQTELPAATRDQMERALASYKAAIASLASAERLNRGQLLRAFEDYNNGTQRFLATLKRFKSKANLQAEALAAQLQDKPAAGADASETVINRLFSACKSAGCSVASVDEMRAKLKESAAFNELVSTLNDPGHSPEQADAALQKFTADAVGDPALQSVFGDDLSRLHEAIENLDLNSLGMGASPDAKVSAGPTVEAESVANANQAPAQDLDLVMKPDQLASLRLPPLQYEQSEPAGPAASVAASPPVNGGLGNFGDELATPGSVPNLANVDSSSSGTDNPSLHVSSTTPLSPTPHLQSVATPPPSQGGSSGSPPAPGKSSAASVRNVASAPSALPTASSPGAPKAESQAQPESPSRLDQDIDYLKGRRDFLGSNVSKRSASYRQADSDYQRLVSEKLKSGAVSRQTLDSPVPSDSLALGKKTLLGYANFKVSAPEEAVPSKPILNKGPADCSPFSYFQNDGRITGQDISRAESLFTRINALSREAAIPDSQFGDMYRWYRDKSDAELKNIQATELRVAKSNDPRSIKQVKEAQNEFKWLAHRAIALCTGNREITKQIKAKLGEGLSTKGMSVGDQGALVNKHFEAYRAFVCGGMKQQIQFVYKLKIDPVTGQPKFNDPLSDALLSCNDPQGPGRLMLTFEAEMRKAAIACGAPEAFVWDAPQCRQKIVESRAEERVIVFRECLLDSIAHQPTYFGQTGGNFERDPASYFLSDDKKLGMTTWLGLSPYTHGLKKDAGVGPLLTNCADVVRNYRFISNTIIHPLFGIQGVDVMQPLQPAPALAERPSSHGNLTSGPSGPR